MIERKKEPQLVFFDPWLLFLGIGIGIGAVLSIILVPAGLYAMGFEPGFLK